MYHYLRRKQERCRLWQPSIVFLNTVAHSLQVEKPQLRKGQIEINIYFWLHAFRPQRLTQLYMVRTTSDKQNSRTFQGQN